MNRLGISGRMAQAFIQSKLTPLILVASLLLGLIAILATPREEEPQIVVPMADVFIPFPGTSPKEVEELVVRPMERRLSEIRGVEYVYSISQPSRSAAVSPAGYPRAGERERPSGDALQAAPPSPSTVFFSPATLKWSRPRRRRSIWASAS